MNLLEHHIERIISAEDVTSDYESSMGEATDEQMIKADFICNCYGRSERVTRIFRKSEFDAMLELGYYMA